LSNNAPIGVFDSGIGGLTVVKELLELMPEENFIYFGDTARVPYGPRPKEEILEFLHQILDFFARKNVKMAVVACNTMTAVGLEMARLQYPFTLVGVNAGVNLAISKSKNKKIGVLATQATIASGKHVRDAFSRDKDTIVYPQACPKLVPLIEAKKLEGVEIESAVAEYVLPMKQAGVDVAILGCTHYPLVSGVIEKVADYGIILIDPARETALEAYHILREQDQLTTMESGKVRLCFSADIQQAEKMAALMLDIRSVDFELVDLQK